MRGERQLLRLGECLVRLACQQLPQDIREERHEEWAAELPAILQDPQIGLAPRRAMRMLAYAADTLRGTALAPGRTPGRIPRLFAALDRLFPVAGLVVVALEVWAIVRAPEDGLNYLWLAWTLLFWAYLLRKRVHSAGPVTALLGIGSLLALAAVYLVQAAQAPGDWVNYLMAALILLPLLVALPVAWWLRRLQARTGGRHAAPSGP
jgi:hypothetical protein